MEARAILEQVRKSGLKVALHDNQIALNPISQLSDDLRQLIRGNRESVTLAIKNAPGRLVTLAIHAGVHEQGYEFSPSEIVAIVLRTGCSELPGFIVNNSSVITTVTPRSFKKGL